MRGSAWVGVGFGGGQLLTFASMLVLARLLDPSAFGVVAVGMTLLTVMTTLQDSGLGAALVHRRTDLEVAASSVLVYGSAVGVALAAVAILVAPWYTHLLHLPEATPYVRALACALAIRGFAVVPNALLEREMNFRAKTKVEVLGFSMQAAVAVSAAFAGLGAWSLVAGQLASTGAQSAMLWMVVPWRPSPFGASRAMLGSLLRYGRFVTGANLVSIANTSLDRIAISRAAGAAALGSYTAAWRVAEIPNTFVGLIVGRVMFSAYAHLQHDLGAVRAAYVENMQRTTLLALPVVALLGVASEPVVLTLLGDQWGAAVTPLRILALYSLVRLVGAPSGEVFKGIGRPQVHLAASIVFFVVVAPSLVLLVPPFGSSGAALAMVVAEVAGVSVAMTLTFRALDLRPASLGHELGAPILCGASVAATLVVLLPLTDSLAPPVELVVLCAAAFGTYLCTAFLFARAVWVPIVAALRRA